VSEEGPRLQLQYTPERHGDCFRFDLYSRLRFSQEKQGSHHPVAGEFHANDKNSLESLIVCISGFSQPNWGQAFLLSHCNQCQLFLARSQVTDEGMETEIRV
jgi:hypothetical protein